MTCKDLMQSEEKDNSDEEWANAYATMDPIFQLGWRNRRGGVEGPVDQLMRDIYEAADVVHSDAMSEMVGSRHNDGDECPIIELATASGSMSPNSDDCRNPTSSVEVDQGGGTSVRSL